MLTHILLRAKKELDDVPTYALKNDIQKANRKIDQNSRSVYAVQAGLGTLGQDLSAAKGKIPANPAQALVQLGTDLQTVKTQLTEVRGKVAVAEKLQNQVVALSAELGTVGTQLRDVGAKAAIADKLQIQVASLGTGLETVGTQLRDVGAKATITDRAQTVLAQQVNQLCADHSQLVIQSANTDRSLASVDQAQKYLLDQTAGLVDEVQALTNSLSSEVRSIESRLSYEADRCDLQAKGLCGNLHLVADAAEDVSAALLNAAAVGTFSLETTVQFTAQEIVNEETLDRAHTWANFEPVVTPSNTGCWDPTVTWTDSPEDDPQIAMGNCRLTVTFDTDAGSAKIYVIGDTVAVTVQVAADDKFNGRTVTQAVKTYNVIA